MVALSNFQMVVNDSAIESKPSSKEENLGEKISPYSRQHSMRKSKVSGELERDVASSIVQSSTKVQNAMPLNPVTPLRWKSTKRIESEKKKLQDEMKTKVVEEEKKNMKLVEEEKDQSPITIVSTGVNGIETHHQVDMPTSNHHSSQEDNMFGSSTSASESTRIISIEEKVEDEKNSHSITNEGSYEQVKHCDEVSSFYGEHGIVQIVGDDSGADRKSLIGDESTATTIDFLRARLLAERASSKVAKERIQQLTKKVQELEGKLNQEIQSSWKAEEAKQEALMKVESLNECKASSPSLNEASCQHEKTKAHELVDQADEECQVFANVEDTKANVSVNIKPDLTKLASLEVNELKVVNEVKAIPTIEQEIEGDQSLQSLDKNESPNVKPHGNLVGPSITSMNGDTYGHANLELQRQEIRLCKKEKLHHMWNEMALEMKALVEDKIVEDCVREGLLNWIHQFPSVTQNILPKPFEPKIMQQRGGDIPMENLDLDQALISKEETMKDCPVDGALCGEKIETHDKGLKEVASLLERFEMNESIQREWKESNAKQNLVEDSNGNSLATNSFISLQEGMTAESSLISKDNIKVDIYIPGDNMPSTYPNSPIVGNKARRSSGDGITPIITHNTLDPSLEQMEVGMQGSTDASFITPPLLSPTCGPRIWEKRGGINSKLEDKLQPLKQSNHARAFDGNCLTPESCSERSSGEIGEPRRSQALIGWVNEEDSDLSPMLIRTRDHSPEQWDASMRGHHLQRERLASYSQAGNSNAYIRPDYYPTRNDEREIYRGRMESVSRSMEGLGSSWRSLSDDESDETQLFTDIPNTMTSSTFQRSTPQMPFQHTSRSSRWLNYYHPQNLEGTSQNYGYVDGEFRREHFRSQSMSNRNESTSTKVNEVLKALQLAKLSIRSSKTRRSTISSERSYAEGDKYNLRTDSVFSDGRITNETPHALRVWSHPEISMRHSTSTC